VRLLFALLLAGCSGSVCGNGQVESGEQCDDGNTMSGDGCSSTCQVEATIDTFVHWQFVATEFPGYPGANCSGLEASRVDLMLTGPKIVMTTASCSDAQVKLSSLPLGDYTIKAAAFDAIGNALTLGHATKTFTAGGQSQNVFIDFPFEDFTHAYTGTFYFTTKWSGATTCDGATPPVAKERVRLERGGVALAGATHDGTPLDGSQTGACHDFDLASAQFANDLAWGPAMLTVTGEEADGTVAFTQTTQTFVGPGLSTFIAQVDVPSILPDAGVPDAPIADAGGSD
jgi:cysteine-rich repeat protein